jgi:hypothetical protein
MEKLCQAATSGMLADVVDLYMTVLKDRSKRGD